MSSFLNLLTISTVFRPLACCIAKITNFCIEPRTIAVFRFVTKGFVVIVLQKKEGELITLPALTLIKKTKTLHAHIHSATITIFLVAIASSCCRLVIVYAVSKAK